MQVDLNRVHRGRIGRRLVFAFILLVMSVVGGLGWVLYDLTSRSLERQMSERLVAIAQLVTEGLDGDVIQRLRPEFSVYSRLQARLRRARDMVGARRIYVFDLEGRSLLDTEPEVPVGREYPRLRFDRSEIDRVWQGEASHSVRFQSEDGVIYKSGYAPIYAGQDVVAGVGVDIGVGFMDTIQSFENSMIFLGAGSALLTVIVGLLLAKTLTGPIRRLVESAKEIGRGNLRTSVNSGASDELGYLGDAMEEMRLKILARDEQLRKMLGGVAHEIRNPLGGIEIYAGLIANDLPDKDPRKEHIRKVIREVQTLNRVISEFLEFARPSPAMPEAFSLSALVEDTVFLLAPELEAAGVTTSREISVDVQVYGDFDQVKRALLNLMKNGVQAMPDGGELTVLGSQNREWGVIAVEDTGIGIPAAAQARLFEPFYTTREQGSGLGLAVVQQVMEENGGSVEVDSTPGKGSVFRVYLPIAKS